MRQFSALLLFAVLGAGATASGAVSPETQLLQRVRYHMSLTLNNLPNYTCLQTIERSMRPAPKKKPVLQDVVRIEVALVNGKELFSWPGSGKFVDTELSKMIPGGASGTGSFGLYARSIFSSNSATFRYEGEEAAPDGRKLHKWTYDVPQILSGFHLRDGVREAVIGYHGAFWVEAATLDLVRLEVASTRIPDLLRIESTADAIEYRRMPIGSENFLLPTLAVLNMVDRNGGESMNRTAFSQCRQYSGESRLLFDESEAEAAASAKVREPERVMDAPGNLTMEVALQSDIVLANAATGDPVTAVLAKPVKVGTGVVLPKGALVHGRITGISRGFYVGPYAAMAPYIDFFEIEAPGWRVRLKATIDMVLAIVPELLHHRVPASSIRRDETIQGSPILVKQGTIALRRGLRMMCTTQRLPD